MILTDGIHVVSDTSIEELHAWADGIGQVKRCWYEAKPHHPHYDLPKKRRGVCPPGATMVGPTELILRMYRVIVPDYIKRLKEAQHESTAAEDPSE